MRAGELGFFSLEQGIYRKAEQALGVRREKEVGLEERRRQVAEHFATLLLFEVFKSMRASIPKGGLFATDSLASDVYTTLADLEVARLAGRKMEKNLEALVARALGTPGQPFPWPVSGRVASPFGPRPRPLGEGEEFHRGIDIAAIAGSPVRAVAAGEVVFSGWAQGYGNLVTIRHGEGLITRYAHHSTNLVSAGESIAAGQIIGLVGSSGRSTGPHLHFEVLQNGKAVDPRPFLFPKEEARAADL